jgi:iron complex outermembrane receptor protein
MIYLFNDAISLTSGLRFVKDEKDFVGTYRMADMAMTDPKAISDEYATGRVALSYNANDSFSVHLVGATGYKPGGFNEYATQPADSKPFKAAEVNSYELGFKSIHSAYHLSINGSIFINDVKNDHVLGFDGITFATNVLNADTKSNGAELDARWSPIDGISVSGAVTYLDSEIKSDVTGVFGGDVVAGNSTPDTPSWSGNFGIDWRHYLSNNLLGEDTAFDASLTYRYQGSRAADPQNNFILDAYSKIDL